MIRYNKKTIIAPFFAVFFTVLNLACAASEHGKEDPKLVKAEETKPTYNRTYRSEHKVDIEMPEMEEILAEEAPATEEPQSPPSDDSVAEDQESIEPAVVEPQETQEEPPRIEEKTPAEPNLSPWEEDMINDMKNVKAGKKDRSNLSQDLVHVFPVADEIQLGQGVAARMLTQTPELENHALWEYVSFIGLVLAENSSRNDLAYYFIVLDAPDDVNAFAAPGGFIFITSGAIKLCDNEAELASLIAHELGHVGYRHGIRMLDLSKYRAMSQSIVNEMDEAFGRSEFYDLEKSMDPRLKKAEEALSLVADQCFEQMLNPFSQEMEFEADAEGMRILSTAGYNPYAAITLLEKLRKLSEDNPAYERVLHSHPPTSERIENLKDIAQKNLLKDEGILKQKRFEHYTKKLSTSE